MKKAGISAWKIAATYIGTVVGAGFATGQELLQFFAGFGISGIWGVLISTLLFIVFGIIIMEIGFTLSAESHLGILRSIGGKMYITVMDCVISVFLFCSLMAMMAGTGALFVQQFRLPAMLGSLVMAAITALTVLCGFSGVINSVSAVVPFLLTSVIGISLFSISKNPPDFGQVALVGSNAFIGNWASSAVLYSSYNIIMSVAVLGPLGARAKDKKALRTGAVLGGGGLGLASVMICLALSGNFGGIASLEVPMAYIAGEISPLVKIAYAVILIAEVYTTAVGSLYGFSARISGRKRPALRYFAIIGVTIAAFLASAFGFSNIVKYLYPVEGYCGLALLLGLLYGKFKSHLPKVYYCRPERF